MVGDADSRLNHPEKLRRHLAIFDAGDADKRDYYAPLRPAYDALQADRKAAIEAIDAKENIAALEAEDEAAYERRAAAHDSLMGGAAHLVAGPCREGVGDPETPWALDAVDESEVEAIIADIEMLKGGKV